MVTNSLYETIKSLPSGQKEAFLNQMKEKLKEGSQIILSDAESVPGAILCKAIFVHNGSDPSRLINGMRTVSKHISNTKRESVTNYPFSHAREGIKSFLMDIPVNKLAKKRTDKDDDFGEVHIAPTDRKNVRDWNLDEETIEEVYKDFTPHKTFEDKKFISYIRNPFSENLKACNQESVS